MTTLALCINFRTAPIVFLEKATAATVEVESLSQDLVRLSSVAEVLILRTCNRVEIYAAVSSFHRGLQEIVEVFAQRVGFEVNDLAKFIEVHYGKQAVEYIFMLASGLKSLVYGETQILGQLRKAYLEAQQYQTVGPHLHSLFQQTLRVGKKVHTDTCIADAGRSIVTAALETGREMLGSLTGTTVVLVGAGSMGALAVKNLRTRGVGRIIVANRDIDKALRLAEPVGAQAISLVDFPQILPYADVIVTATASMDIIVEEQQIQQAQNERNHRPLLLIDLALPHNIDASAANIAGVTLVNIASLIDSHQQSGPLDGDREMKKIIDDEVALWEQAWRESHITPAVAALRSRASEVVATEMARFRTRVVGDEHVYSQVEQSLHRVVQQLLHVPTVRAKELTDQQDSYRYAALLKELFALDTSSEMQAASVYSESV